MFCQNCGANLPDESKFCHTCGNQIGIDRNAVPQRVVTDTTPEGLKPWEKEALRYKEKAKMNLIFLAISGIVFLFGIIKYNNTESWLSRSGYGFLSVLAFYFLITYIIFWFRNKKQSEKYETMNDQEWRDEMVKRKQTADFTRDVTTSVVKGFIRGLFS